MKKGCRLLVPDGSLEKVVHQLLADAGLRVSYPDGDRSYQGVIGNERLFPPPFNVVTKMRPWDAVWVVADGKAELAFVGEDLVQESGFADKVCIIDTYPLSRGGVGFTKLVVAVPKESTINQLRDIKPGQQMVTEYPNIARSWCDQNGLSPKIRSCHGSLEAFRDIADLILENTETGSSLTVNSWRVITEVMTVRTALITNPAVLGNKDQVKIIEDFKLLLSSVIEARPRLILKCNVLTEKVDVDRVVAFLPALSSPTKSALANGKGYALESVVDAKALEWLIPGLRDLGASAIVAIGIDRFVG